MIVRRLFFVLLAVYLVAYRAIPLAHGPAVYRDGAPIRMTRENTQAHIGVAVALYLYAAWRDAARGADAVLSVLWLLMDLTLVSLTSGLRIRNLSLPATWLLTVPFMVLLPWPSRHQWAWTRAFLIGSGVLSLAVEVKRWFATRRTTARRRTTS